MTIKITHLRAMDVDKIKRNTNASWGEYIMSTIEQQTKDTTPLNHVTRINKIPLVIVIIIIPFIQRTKYQYRIVSNH